MTTSWILGLSRTLARALFVTAMAMTGIACSTVKVRTETNAVTKEGISAAEEMRRALANSNPRHQLADVGDKCVELLRVAQRQEMLGQKERAAALYLEAAVFAREEIERGELGPTAETRADLIQLHNSSLARFGELWSTDPRRRVEGPHLFVGNDATYEIASSGISDYSPDFFDRAIASESIRGSGVVDKEREGFGASLVAIRDQLPGREAELQDFSERGVHVPVTLTVDSVEDLEGEESLRKRVLISLHDPTRRETVMIGANRFPLAGDFSAPMEIMLRGRNEMLWGLSGFLNARKRAENSGIYLIEPYDPDRIPVILSHGLISVPIIWRDIIPEFLSEPDLAKRYQFMVFTYPSSYPIAESAKLMRDELEDLRQRYDPDRNDPLSNNLVAMGHSMGGILTHLLVAEMGDLFWNQVSDIPIDELDADEEQIEFLRELAFFDADPATRRVVFLSTPHRGAEMATLGIADSVSRLAKFPVQVLDEASSIRKGPPIPGLKVDVSKKVTSVQSLRPDSAIALALDEAPYKRGVVYHSIIGDRGKGDTPNSSDGVVDYWSSHQDGAASELIVPTDHGSYEDPGAIAELKRILRVHVGIQ